MKQRPAFGAVAQLDISAKDIRPQCGQTALASLVRALDGMKPLDPNDSRTKNLERLMQSHVKTHPAERFEPSFGQEMLLAGRHMFLVTRSGGHTYGDQGRSSLGRVSIQGIVDREPDGGFKIHVIEGLDVLFESALECLDSSSIRLKQLRTTTTIPKKTFLGPELLDLPPRMADPQMVLQYGVYRQVYDAVLDELRGRDFTAKNILDLGCGKGDLLVKIRQAHPNANVYGLEYFEENAKRARGKLRMAGAGAGQAEDMVMQGDAKTLGSMFEGLRFHALVSTGLLNHQTCKPKDALAIVAQWPKKLHNGAKVILSGFTPIILDPQDLDAVGVRIEKTSIPKNLFNFAEPKELFAGEFSGPRA